MSSTVVPFGKSSLNRRVVNAASAVTAAALVVKLCATAKEFTVAGVFGRSDALESFLAAALIPSLLINLIAESMNQALVPALVRAKELEGRDRAQQLLSTSVFWNLALLIAASLTMALAARLFFPLIGSRFSVPKLDLAVHLFYGLLPVIILSGVCLNMAPSAEKPDALHQNSLNPPHILVGVTIPQTCLVLRGRLQTLREAGFRVSLLSAPGQLLNDTARNDQVAAFAVPMQRGISPIADTIALFRIWRLLRRLRPDVVEFSTPKAGLLGTLAARLCRIPARVYFLRGLKLETAFGLKRILLLLTERIASASASVVICNSRSLRQKALALHIGTPSELVVLGNGSSNGVDLERFLPGSSNVRSLLGIPEDAPVIGFAGRLTEDKGLPELLEAFAAILRAEPSTRLILVGWFDAAEDALGIALRKRIEGHPSIICTGFVADTAPYYRAMDLMVLPSLREGFPNVVLEAAATGIPVIGTLCTGSRDVVVPEVTGMLVPPGHPDAITEAVLRLLHDPARRLEMGNAARRWAVENYENKRVLALAIDFYMGMISSADTLAPHSSAKLRRRATGLPVLP